MFVEIPTTVSNCSWGGNKYHCKTVRQQQHHYYYNDRTTKPTSTHHHGCEPLLASGLWVLNDKPTMMGDGQCGERTDEAHHLPPASQATAGGVDCRWTDNERGTMTMKGDHNNEGTTMTRGPQQ